MLIFFLNVINFMIITPVIKQIHSTDVYVLSWCVCDFLNVSVRWHDMEQEKKLMNLDWWIVVVIKNSNELSTRADWIPKFVVNRLCLIFSLI